jgi:hypothetical protein
MSQAIEDLDLYDRMRIAKAHLNYWWVKDEAIKLGRLKTCRAMKAMKHWSLPYESMEDVRVRASKVETKILREHYNNLKFIVENDDFISDRERFTGVALEYRRGQIIVNCNRPQAVNNYVLRILDRGSNLPDDAKKLLLLGDGPTRFSFSYVGMRKFSNSAANLEQDYVEIQRFLRKLRDTIGLANRVAPLIPNIENYYYFDRYKSPLRVEFMGIPRDGCVEEDIFKSALRVTGLPNDEENKYLPGRTLPEDQIPEQNTPQQALNRYVNTRILSRRRF